MQNNKAYYESIFFFRIIFDQNGNQLYSLNFRHHASYI